MRMRFATLVLLPLPALAQTPPPLINPGGIVRSDSRVLRTLAPGASFSIYGRHLGPEIGCHSDAAKELCGVQVLVGDAPAELSYVQEKQINARMPAALPGAGKALLRVVFQGVASAAATVQLGPLPTKIALDGEARVNGPVWIRVAYPDGGAARYPVRTRPWDFGCDSFEVRRDGKPLTPVSPNPPIGEVFSGFPCGSVGFPGPPPSHTGRLPLHLQFRFGEPGIYEVRYTHRFAEVLWQSDWTSIEVLPPAPRTPPARHPQDPGEILADFLPNLLAQRNDEALDVLLEYLYHPSHVVRGYASLALYYWPADAVQRRLVVLQKTDGPADVAIQQIDKAHLADLADSALPRLASDDAVLRGGALSFCRAALGSNPSGDLRQRVEQALIRAADAFLSHADAQGTNDFIATLGQVRDEAAHRLLWTLADRGVGREQALIAISWRKDATDLPRLAQPLLSEISTAAAALPYAIHAAFGDAALPYLRDALDRSPSDAVRAGCAEELIVANDPAGYAFALRAVRESRPYRSRLTSFIADRFPQTRNLSEAALLDFLQHPPAQTR